MASIELYINKQLCEIENPDNFSVYLKRTLINPAELSTKDAQRSYDITLPATATNNAIFGYTNTEEVKGKFAQLYDAQLIINGIKIFNGKFKMSEITKTTYKGNLGIPAQKTVKDIFGEMKMNEAGKWLIPFENPAEDMTKYNTGKYDKDKLGDIAPCIFPLVLYGLLPKEPADEKNIYTSKTVYDETVKLKLNDIPPSINCMQTIKHIFDSKNLRISGTAFDDERLTKLYMSYKNPKEYVMPWNYGKLAHMQLKGFWQNRTPDGRKESRRYRSEENTGDEHDEYYNVNLLDAVNSKITHNGSKHITEPGNNKYEIVIPETGLYKITFKARLDAGNMRMDDYDDNGEDTIISSKSSKKTGDIKDPTIQYHYDNFTNNRHEVKLMRYEGEFDKSSFKYDNLYCKNNQDQEDYFTSQMYPGIGAVNFVDIAQNENFLCGFSFGIKQGNPLDKELFCNPMAIKNGDSWNKTLNSENKNKPIAIINNTIGYYQYKKNEQGETEIKPSDYYKIQLDGTPIENKVEQHNDHMLGIGSICQIVKLNAGEKIALAAHSKVGHMKLDWTNRVRYGWIYQEISFEVEIEAFRQEKDIDSWVKVNKENTGTGRMKWDDEKTFLTKDVDLIKFLPSNENVNDWVENFCKAFNLSLIQTAPGIFELNTNNIRFISTGSIIDLDTQSEVNINRKNNSLSLPSVYEVGFKIDKEEQGYLEPQADRKGNPVINEDGGGRVETGSPEVKTINQTSNFSYNWFKVIDDQVNNSSLLLPVISPQEAWENVEIDYYEMQNNYYKDKAQRFWYLLNSKNFNMQLYGNEPMTAALVSNRTESTSPMWLDYKGESQSILDAYFTLLTDADNNYTTVECFLTPEEYKRIPYSFIRLNGDLYYVAEIDGYDPLCKKRTILKLIRSIK